MPNPLSKVKPIKSMKFDNTALTLRPVLAINIGNTLAEWARLDAVIGSVFTRLMDAEEKGPAIYGALISGNAQEQALDAVANLMLDKDHLDLFNAIKSITKRPRDQRNNLAHGSWGYSDEIPDALLWVSPKELVRLNQRTDSYAQNIGLGSQPDFPQIDRDQVLVYREPDFALIRQQIREAHVAWQDFSTINKLGWQRGLHPKQAEEARLRLFGHSAIRAHIERARQNRGEPPLPPL